MELPVAFGKYELLERIATGGMAEVFLARSFGVAGFEKRLVIKRIRPELAQDPRFVAMFVNEAKIGVHLNHPNVVQTYDLGRTGSDWYMAMEHLHGRDLNRVVKVLRSFERRLPLPIAVSIVAEMCRGLAYAHSRADGSGAPLGLVHRDVSPHNVVVTFDGEVKLVDFGIARLMNSGPVAEPQDPAHEGRPGGGKYAYMSPEQARGQDVDLRTDVFSAGIVLWELCAGRRLFQDADPVEKLRRVQQAIVPDPRSCGGEADEALWIILQKALERERHLRYDTAALFEDDLRAWLFERGEPAGRPEIARLMRELFPLDVDRSMSDVDIRNIVADVEQLDGGTAMSGASLTSGSPAEGRPPAIVVGERKTVTAMFVDVDGLTALSERLEPETMFRARHGLLRWMTRAARAHGGQVQRIVDDQILVLFGVPRTHADDATHAVELACEIVRRAPELRAIGLDVQFAVGIHVGEVTVGPGPRRVRYEARGNTTRLARRLSGLADHGQVLVSERVLAITGAEFRFRRGPDLPNRSLRQADTTFEVEGRRRGLRLHGKGIWLRRGVELDVLRESLVDVADGVGRLVVLVGPEGSGKSRLVRELRDLALRREHKAYIGRCRASAVGAFDVFPDLLVDVLGLDPEPPVAELPERFARLHQLGLARRDVDVLQNAWQGSEAPDPDEAWQALARVIVGLAREAPSIIAIEDAQNLPAAVLPRLQRLVQVVLRHPVLLILTWRGLPSETIRGLGVEVTLGALSSAAQRKLVKSLLDVLAVDEPLANLIERSCEGNPLYVEELVKYLANSGRVVVEEGVARLSADDDVPIPDTLAGVVAARIDRLDPAAKGALQLAAVIGLTFQSSLLAEAAGLQDPAPILAELVGNGLVGLVNGHGDAWTFSGELVHRAALRGILGVQRRDHHRLVAAAIERTDPEHRVHSPEVLAGHCAAGGRFLDAARYAYRAGERLEKVHALERARECYERGLGYIREERERPEIWDARVQGEAMLSLRAGIVAVLLGDARRGEKAIQLALDISSDAGIPWVEVRAHVELGRSYLSRGKFELASAHLAQAREQLHLNRDAELELEAIEASAILAHERGDNEESELQWHEALARAQHNPGATARCLIGLANRHLRAGETDVAAPLLERAELAARTARDRILEGRVLNNMGLLHASAGRHDEALTCFRRALEVREGIGYVRGVVVNYHNIGDVHFSRGDWAHAGVAFDRSRELALEAGWERGVVFNEVYLGYLDAVRGREGEGMARIAKAAEDARRLGDVETAVTGEWLAGRWFVEQMRWDHARKRLAVARSEADRYGLKSMYRSIEALEARLP